MSQRERKALSAYTSVIEEHRDTLAMRCTQLQTERNRLAQQCDKLEADAARVAVLTAENDEMRTKIDLVNTESRARMTRDGGILQTLERESQLQAETHRRRILELEEKAKVKQAEVEQEALAWHLMWKEEAKKNYKPGGHHNNYWHPLLTE